MSTYTTFLGGGTLMSTIRSVIGKEKVKSFIQADLLQETGHDPTGVCYALSIDWARRLLLGRSDYTAKKFTSGDDAPANRKRMMDKAHDLQEIAKKLDINANYSTVSEDWTAKRFPQAVA